MLDTQSLTESFLVLLYFDAMFPTINREEPEFFFFQKMFECRVGYPIQTQTNHFLEGVTEVSINRY